MPFPDDLQSVRCDQAREALSARLDGEDPGVPGHLLDAHVDGCPSCRAWSSSALDAARPLRVRPAPTPSDLAPAVLAGLHDHPEVRTPLRRGARVGLVLTALAQLLLTVPALRGGGGHEALHVVREIGVTEAALALGVLAAAWRPWRAAGMLPVVAALAVGLGATSALDLAGGETTPLAEAPHLLALLEVWLLWRLRSTAAAPGAPSGRAQAVLRRVA